MARVAVAGMPGSDADTAEGQNRGVRSAIRRLFLVSGVSAALLGGGLLLLQRWVSSDDFRLRVEAQAGQALARPVHIGRLSVDLWPTPGVALEQVRIETRPAMAVGRIEVWASDHDLPGEHIGPATESALSLQVAGAARLKADFADLYRRRDEGHAFYAILLAISRQSGTLPTLTDLATHARLFELLEPAG